MHPAAVILFVILSTRGFNIAAGCHGAQHACRQLVATSCKP
jgi:hypothetical protein